MKDYIAFMKPRNGPRSHGEKFHVSLLSFHDFAVDQRVNIRMVFF